MPTPTARGIPFRWSCVMNGLRMKTIAAARISGGKMTATFQATQPTMATATASPTNAQATDPARRIASVAFTCHMSG